MLQALQAPACHENMVKVGSYILGEFGNLIAGDPRSRSVTVVSASKYLQARFFKFTLAYFLHQPDSVEILQWLICVLVLELTHIFNHLSFSVGFYSFARYIFV